MLKSERVFTTYYPGGARNGIAILRTDGSLLVQPDHGVKMVIKGVAEAVLEENAAYLAWRESQGGTPGAPMQPCVECGNDYAEGYCPHGRENLTRSELAQWCRDRARRGENQPPSDHARVFNSIADELERA